MEATNDASKAFRLATAVCTRMVTQADDLIFYHKRRTLRSSFLSLLQSVVQLVLALG